MREKGNDVETDRDGSISLDDIIAECFDLLKDGALDEAKQKAAEATVHPDADTARGKGKLAELVRELVDIEAKRLDVDRETYLAMQAAQLLDQAIAKASENPDEGLRSLDICIDALSKVKVLDAYAASAYYNRGAILQKMKLTIAADRDFRTVVAEYSGHNNPEIQFWVAIALFNHAWLLVHRSILVVHKHSAKEAIHILDRLFREFHRSSHPGIRDRLVRGVSLYLTTFELIGQRERFIRGSQRLRSLFSDDNEMLATIDQKCADVTDDSFCEAPPEDLTTAEARAALIAELIFTDDLDAVALIGLLEDDSAREELAFQAPHLLTAKTHEQLQQSVSLAGDDGWRGLLASALTFLDALRQKVESDPFSYKLGRGPLERIFPRVTFDLNEAAAMELARKSHVVRSLSRAYVIALTEHCVRDLNVQADGWRTAVVAQRIILASIDQLPDDADSYELRKPAYLTWLTVARAALCEVPDPRIFRQAVRTGERLIEEARRYSDNATESEALTRLAQLYVEPYVADRPTGDSFFSSLRRWHDRLSEEINDPTVDFTAEEWRYPTFTEALDTAELHLRKSLDIGAPEREGLALFGLLSVCVGRCRIAPEVHSDDLKSLLLRIRQCVSTHRYPQLRMNALSTLAATGEVLTKEEVEECLPTSIEKSIRDYGPFASAQIVETASRLLRTLDNARGLSLFIEARDLVNSFGETRRFSLLRAEFLLLADTGRLGHCNYTGQIEDVVQAIHQVAGSEGWDGETIARTVLFAGAYHDPAEVHSNALRRLDLFDFARRLAPRFCADHDDSIKLTRAGALADLATRCGQREQWALSVPLHCQACCQFADIGFFDAALESLTLLEHALKNTSEDVSKDIFVHLRKHVAKLEVGTNGLADRVLQRIWRLVISRIGTQNGNLLFGCMQLAKGHRFSLAVQAGARFDYKQDPSITFLLEAIDAALAEREASQNAAGQEEPTPVNELLLLGPYDRVVNSQAPTNAANRVRNIKRHFDNRVQSALHGCADVDSVVLDIPTLQKRLPGEVVVLSLYFGIDQEKREAVYAVCITADQCIVVRQPLSEQQTAYKVEVEDEIIIADNIQLAMWRTRAAVQLDSWGDVSDEGAKVLATGYEVLFGSLKDVLAGLWAAGSRHLCIIPHGAFHFAPLHLFGPRDHPLADDWIVTYLPSVSMVPRQAVGLAGCDLANAAVIGIGFSAEPSGGLEPIPEAAAEAVSIAAMLDVSPMLEHEATKHATLKALESCVLFHLATHGEHDVDAPSLQRLFLAGGHGADSVAAYEILGLDLSRVGLVTLSACETGLGRFDISDNLRGLPASLFIRGVSAIVATFWPVETECCVVFFGTMYEALKRGESRRNSFRTAQIKCRERYPNWRDWGAFQYVGDWS